MNFIKNLFVRRKDKQQELFPSVIGFSDIKEIFELSLKSEKPVAILLCGPPACAKSLFMTDILNRYGDQCHYAVGSSSTKTGIFDMLFEKRSKYLLVDEIDKMNKKDQASLLNLMESGILSITKHREIRQTQLKCWVFATANEGIDTKLLEPLLTRFQVFYINEYSRAEFIDISIKLLEKEGIYHDSALSIASIVYDELGTNNMRQVMRLANMLKTTDTEKIDQAQLRRLVKTILKYGDKQP